VFCCKSILYSGSSVGVKINPAAGCAGRGDKEKREKDMQLSAQIELYVFI
jgi:hypothetical protein